MLTAANAATVRTKTKPIQTTLARFPHTPEPLLAKGSADISHYTAQKTQKQQCSEHQLLLHCRGKPPVVSLKKEPGEATGPGIVARPPTKRVSIEWMACLAASLSRCGQGTSENTNIMPNELGSNGRNHLHWTSPELQD